MGSPLLLGAGTFAPPLPPYDPDAQAFFTAESAAGVTLTSTQMTAVNDLVINCKAANIWTKFKALYPVVGGSAVAHKFNLKNPADTDAAFRILFSGGWTHSATGMLPNGTNASADTRMNAFTHLTLTDSHASYYSRTNVDNIGMEFGDTVSGFGSITRQGNTMYSDYPGNGSVYSASPDRITVANASSNAFFIHSSTATNVKVYKNNSILGTKGSAPSSGFSSANILLSYGFISGANRYSSRELALVSFGNGFTDLESQVFNQIVEGYEYALGRSNLAAKSFYYNPAYSNETNAFLYSTQITDTTIQTATNTLVSDLKTANLWTKMKAIYPMVGGTATTHKYNLKDPQDTNAAFRLNLIGGWTHSSTGALPNGTNAYAQTFLVPGTTLGLYLMSVGYYSRTNSAGNFVDMGVINGAASNNPTLDMYIRTGSNLMSTWMSKANATGRLQSAVTDSRGFFVQASNGTTTQTAYKNGVSIGSNAATGLTINTYGIFLAAENSTGVATQFSNRECAFSFIADGFSSTDVTNLNIAVQAFNTTLGRQV